MTMLRNRSNQAAELRHVNIDLLAADQRHEFAVDLEDGVFGRSANRLAQTRDLFAKIGSSVFVVAVWGEQRRERVAPLGNALIDRQIGEQGTHRISFETCYGLLPPPHAKLTE